MLQVRVDGQVTFNGTYETLDAALAGYETAYVPAELAAPHVAAGRLDSVLADWCPTFPGHHLYYASRRQSSRALAVIVERCAIAHEPTVRHHAPRFMNRVDKCMRIDGDYR